MNKKIAEFICIQNSSNDSWSHIVQNAEAFIWSDDEDLIQTLNKFIQIKSNFTPVQATWESAIQLKVAYKGINHSIQLQSNQDDQLIIIHALANIIGPDFEIRFCKDSFHSSDLAFLCMDKGDWICLEEQFSIPTVSTKFLTLKSTFSEFLEKAFPPSDIPLGRLSPEMTDWDGGKSYQPHQLNYTIIFDENRNIRLSILSDLMEQYLATTRLKYTLHPGTDTAIHISTKHRLLELIHLFIGKNTIRVSDFSGAGFLIVEINGVAAGWRTDGKIFTKMQARKKWWYFWK